MALKFYDYVCENDQCESYNKVEERMIDSEERDDQRCELCGITLKRKVSGLKTKHISWSTWQV